MKRLDIFVIGSALFSMFFGAGNVIFPPYLGLGCGAQWFLGFVCYYLADIGLALLALFAILRQGSPEAVLRRAGRIPSALLMGAVALCIGPMLAIPRTAATTYELSLEPLLSGISPALFSGLFFAVIFLLCLRESAVVDIVGKILTPALLLCLFVLIICGVVNPIGPVPDRVLVEHVPVTGIEAGYQTMDVLAAMVFGILVLESAREKGHTTPRAHFQVVAGAGAVAGAALMVIYLGLTYLGVTTSRLFDLSVTRAELMLSIVRTLLGFAGVAIFAVAVALACITTAAALVSATASYFSRHTGRPYKTLVAAICLVSAVVSSFGLDLIVSIATPILGVLYPPTLALITLSFFDSRIKNDQVYRMAALGALVASVLTAAADLGVPLSLLGRLPLAELGLGWVVPAAVCGVLGALPGHFKRTA